MASICRRDRAADLTELTMEVWPPHGGRTGTYDAALHGRSIDLRALLREHFYVDARGFSLALPEPWPDLGAVQALDGGGLLLYCRALGPECGGIAQLHIETEPLEVLTGRDTLLGGREGCWLYLYGLQAPLPSLREAGRGYRSSTMRCIRPCTPTRRSCCPSGRRADHRRQLPAPHPRRRRASSSAVMPLI